MNKLWNAWKEFCGKLNQYGIPVFTIRDPKIGTGSVSLTLVFVSSILVVLGLVGKWSGRLGVIDIHNALEFFGVSCGLYFGRNWRTGANVSAARAADDDEKSKNVDDPDGK